MSTTITLDNYEQLLRQSGLIKKQQLTQFIDKVEQRLGKRPSTELLSKCLLKAGLLTEWQQSLLVRGYTKGFFVGKYKLLSHLGTGGMSQVYLAEHTLMHRQVALKILNQELTESRSYLERFYRESRATASLDHPNIVRTFDVDCEGKLNYMVMEYMSGPSLQELVEEEGPLPYDVAANYIRQSALGLHYAHEAGLIHRDIKPGNLMLNDDKIVKLLDFGMVRLTKDEMTSITIKHNESMLGTADYLSPEQALDSHDVDTRTDIYSLGCTFYFFLTAHPPFTDGSMALRLMKHQTEDPSPIYADRQDAPEELVDICSKMMKKAPEERYQTAGEIARDVEAWLRKNGYARPDKDLHSVVSLRAEEDTLDDSSHRTVVQQEATYMIDESADSQVRISCESCRAIIWVPPKKIDDSLLCPRCSEPLATQTADQKKAAAEFKIWKFSNYEKALRDRDPKLLAAVKYLCDRFPGSEKVGKVLIRLLQLAADEENESLNEETRVKADRKIVKGLIDAVATIHNEPSTKMLQRVIVGHVFKGPSDPIAAEAAIDALARHSSTERETFLVNLLVGAEAARPPDRGRYTASELRVKVAGLYLHKEVSAAVRKLLEERRNIRSLTHESKALLERILDQ